MANYTKQTARKDYPKEGIKKGDVYYKWSFRFGGEYRSLTPPTRGQLTQSDYFGAVYALFDGPPPESPEDLESMADDLEQIGTDQQDKFDNMPEGLQQGDTGQMLEERASACEAKAGELRELAEDWRAALEEHEQDLKDYDEEKAKYLDALDEFRATPPEQQEVAEEPSEPDEPDELDPQEFIDRISECEPE